MTVRKALPIFAASLALTACGMMPGNTDTSAEAPAESPAQAGSVFTETLSTPALTVSTEPPGNDYYTLGQFTRYSRADCGIGMGRDAAVQEATRKLRDEAVSRDADYLYILGTGDLYERGMCDERMFQLTGKAFVKRAPAPAAGDNGGMGASAGGATDSLTARLEELDALLERGLINQSEYDQLREQVLDEAY
mgnify:CR=1 FL=1